MADGTRGRRKKDMSPAAEARRKRSAERIQTERMRQFPKMSKEVFAKELGIDRRTLTRYEDGEVDLPLWSAKNITRLMGGHPAYWQGFSPTKDPVEWAAILKQNTTLNTALLESFAEQQAEREKNDAALHQFFAGLQAAFSFIGVRYSYSMSSDTHTIDGLGGEHIGEFTWDELTELLTELQNTIRFFGYKKNQSRAK